MNYVDVAGKQKSKKKTTITKEKKTTKQHNLLCNDFTLTLACTYACTSFTLVIPFTKILLCSVCTECVCILITQHENIFARSFQFSFLQKVKVKSNHHRSISISL